MEEDMEQSTDIYSVLDESSVPCLCSHQMRVVGDKYWKVYCWIHKKKTLLVLLSPSGCRVGQSKAYAYMLYQVSSGLKVLPLVSIFRGLTEVGTWNCNINAGFLQRYHLYEHNHLFVAVLTSLVCQFSCSRVEFNRFCNFSIQSNLSRLLYWYSSPSLSFTKLPYSEVKMIWSNSYVL